MNTNLQIKTFKDPLSLGVRDCNKKVNRTTNEVETALINRKETYGEKTNNSIKEAGKDGNSTKRKDIASRVQVSIDFAADQWFRTLLVYLNSKNNKLTNISEPIPGAFCG